MNPDIKTYYDNLAAEYDKDRFDNSYGQYIHTQEIEILNSFFINRKDERVLDLACGTGRLTHYATDGLDVSPNMIAEAKQKHPNKVFSIASADQQPFNTKSFDVVYSFHAFMHFDQVFTERVFQEVYRVLKPGGVFIFDIPSRARRDLINYKSKNWHGSQGFTAHDIKQLFGDQFIIKRSVGIAMFPIHRLPIWSRSFLRKIDSLLCRTPLNEYASYNVFFLIKK